MKRPLTKPARTAAGLLVVVGVFATTVLPFAGLPPAAVPRVFAASSDAPALTDVAGNWAESEITALYAQGIVLPKAGTEFRPDDKITRIEFCGFIARAVGLPLLPYGSLFLDVPATLPEGLAVEAANRAGIVNGTGSGRFSPSSQVTREQMAAMFLRAYLYATRESTAPAGKVPVFNDSTKISPWALESVNFATSAGLMSGREAQVFAPADAATRAEAAAMVHRLLTNFPAIAAGRTQQSPPIFTGSVLSLAVAPSDPQTIYAGGGEWGGVIKSSNGGQTWANMAFNAASETAQGDVREITVAPDDRDLVTITTDAAGAWPAGVLQSKDGGHTWDRMGNFQEDLHVHGLAVLPSGRFLASSYGGIRFAANGTNWRWATDLYTDPLPSQRADAALGRSDKATFGFLAFDPTDEKLVIAPARYETGAPNYYYTIYLSRDAGFTWGGFLTVGDVKPGPGWRAIGFPPGALHTFVVGTDLYTASSTEKAGFFIDESTVAGVVGAYRVGANGRRLQVTGYSFPRGDGRVFYALASATTQAGADVTVILRSADGGRTWTRHEAVLPDGAAQVTAMAVSFSPEAGRPDAVFLADRGRPADPAEPAHNLVGHIYRAPAVEADDAWRFTTVYSNRKPE